MTAISLLLASVLMLISILLQPSVDEPAGSLAAMSDAGVRATVSVLAFAYAQVPFLVSMLGLAQLIGDRAPILSNLVATFGVLGAFGHAVTAGSMLVTLSMAADTENRAVYNGLLSQEPGWVDGPPMLLGLLGTVLAILFLAIGLLRTNTGPRWVPFALFAFLAVEFVGTSITVWAGPAAAALYVLTFGTLAVVVWRSPVGEWTTARAERVGSSTAENTTR